MTTHLERMPTGIPGLDEVLMGGLIPRRTYLIVGRTGTGKTVLSLQWLLAGQKMGEQGLYISLAEPVDEIAKNVASFGWSVEGLAVRELVPSRASIPVEEEYTVFPPSDVESTSIWNAIYQAVEEVRPSRLVIDSAAQLRALSVDEYQFRKQILTLVKWLNQQGCTTLLIFEPTIAEHETSLTLAVDGVIRLWHEVGEAKLLTLRGLQVDKMRGSDFLSGIHAMRITNQGLVVFPHRIEPPAVSVPASGQVPSGVPELDEMLHGGIEIGTSTIISGPAGVGKTTLAIQFMCQAAQAGLPGIIYSFEEPTQFMRERAARIGLPVEALIGSGQLRFQGLNPMTLYPDEFLKILREAVEQDGRRAVMLDSTRGYHIAMEQFGALNVHLHNMLSYLNHHGITTFLVNEVERLTGELVITEIGVSYIVDNVLLLRYAEVDGRLMHVVSCLKKRLGEFEPDIREFRITRAGLQVGHRLEGLRGVLTGIPERR